MDKRGIIALLALGLFLVGCGGGTDRDPRAIDHGKKISVKKVFKDGWKSDEGTAKFEKHLIADPVVYSGSEHDDLVIIFGGGRYDVWLGEGAPGKVRRR